MQIIVGLGNPGEQYKNTRHNLGWLALDSLVPGANWKENKKFQALVYEDGDRLFVKPLVFMNNSGQTVRKILDYYKLLPKNLGLVLKKDSILNNILTIIHDDLDLDFGIIKIAVDSGSAGHRGVESVINHLKTKRFTRIRLGVKNELLKIHIPPDKFVLQAFNQEEKSRLPEIFTKINLKELFK